MNKTLIENSSLELLELFDKVSKEAQMEKGAVPAINKILHYWTRKPLIVGRAMVLASTLKNISDVEKLLKIHGDKRAYMNTPSKEIYQKLLGKSPSNIKILDPFAGTGNLLFPALELGLDVTCSDYNPVAYLIEQAVLKYPPKLKNKLHEKFKIIAKQIIDETEKEVGKFFSAKYLTYLWLWCITCPHCSQRVPLTNKMWIINSKNKKIGIRFTPTKDKNFTHELIENMNDDEGNMFTQKRKKAQCIRCNNSINYDTITKNIAANKDREMIAIQIQKNKTRDYISPTKDDKKLYNDAVKFFKKYEDEFKTNGLIPTEYILPNYRVKNALWNYGITHWNEFFSERQLLVLVSFLKNIQNRQYLINKNFDDMFLYISFLLSKRAFMSGYGTIWNSTGGKLQDVFTFRQPRITFNHGEVNPFEKGNGSFPNMLQNIEKAIQFSTRLQQSAKCELRSVTKQNKKKYDLIITDPPYGDDVPYGELSGFTYAWLYRALKNIYPNLPTRPPLEEDFCEAEGRFGDKALASQFFETGLKKSFISMNQKLKNDGLLVVFFAHSSVKAWNQLLASIREGKFRVVSSYAIHTESSSSILARGKTSFTSSIVVVCRKIKDDSEEFFEDIIPKIEDNIKEMIEQIPDNKLLTLPITDLLIMVYGKVLESCTKHTILKSRQKDFSPNFETLIKDARSFIMQQLVAKLTKKSVNHIGPMMAFYILIKVFNRGIVVGDHTLKIMQAYGIDEFSILEKNHIVTTGKQRRLCYLTEHEMNYPIENVDRNNLHQQLCYITHLVNIKKTDKIQTILRKENFRVDDLKRIISLILKSFNMQKNKGVSLNSKENHEVELLIILSDLLGMKREEGLDPYFQND